MSKGKKITLIIALIIVALISVEAVIRLISGAVTEKIKDEEISAIQGGSSGEADEVQIGIETAIDQFLEYTQSGDYEKLYSLLNEEYIDYMAFKNAEEFQKYLEDYFGKIDSIRLRGYTMKGDMYFCTIIVQSEGTETNQSVLVKLLPKGEFEIIPDDIVSIRDLELTSTVDNVKYDIRKVVQKGSTLEYELILTNTASKEATCLIDNITLLRSNGVDYSATNKSDFEKISINPQKSVRVVLSFEVPFGDVYSDSELTLTLKDPDGKEKIVTILIEA